MTTQPQPLTEILAAFVAETPAADVPAAAIEPAKNVILDTIGVALAAVNRPVGKIITGHVEQTPGSPVTASVLGAGRKASPEMAALANGTLANALDFDDGSHLATHILPAALAVTEDRELPGRALLDAFIVAHEAAARLTQLIDARRRQQGGPTHRGWWHVGLIGPIAAALAACRLHKMNRRQTATAIGIASCSSGGFRRNMGTMAKALHSGNAARAGIEAATLARHGFTADTAILEAPLGFLQAVVLPADRDVSAVTERLGRPYVLEGSQRIKRFPACNPGHPLIDAALRLVHGRHVRADEIELVEADLHTFSLLRPVPADEDGAGFSGAFLIAVTLIHGEFTLDQLTDEGVHDARVRALMQRIRHVPAGDPETMTVTLRDGRAATVEVPPVRRLTTRESISEKFQTCAGAVLAEQSIDVLQNQILTLDAQPDLTRMMQAASNRR